VSLPLVEFLVVSPLLLGFHQLVEFLSVELVQVLSFLVISVSLQVSLLVSL